MLKHKNQYNIRTRHTKSPSLIIHLPRFPHFLYIFVFFFLFFSDVIQKRNWFKINKEDKFEKQENSSIRNNKKDLKKPEQKSEWTDIERERIRAHESNNHDYFWWKRSLHRVFYFLLFLFFNKRNGQFFCVFEIVVVGWPDVDGDTRTTHTEKDVFYLK